MLFRRRLVDLVIAGTIPLGLWSTRSWTGDRVYLTRRNLLRSIQSSGDTRNLEKRPNRQLRKCKRDHGIGGIDHDVLFVVLSQISDGIRVPVIG